jgi:hypothetical protein
MLKIKNLRGECQHCGGPVEFHAEFTGTTADCPHCGRPTELLLAAPPEEGSPVRTKAIVFTAIAILILLGGLIGAVIALKRAERLKASRLSAQTQAESPNLATPGGPFAGQGFRVSAVELTQGQGGTLIYAVGSMVNTSNRQRFGVKVELELLNAEGVKIGKASDYQKVIEPNGEWKFRALVVEKRTVAARVIGIQEDQ